MRKSYIIIALVLLAGLSACTPESLEGLDEADNNTANNENNANNANNENNLNNENNANNQGEFTTEFIEVAGIMVDNCTQAVCHGSSSTTSFAVASDQLADESEILVAFEGDDLEGITADASGMPLIEPGDAEGSDIYDRMNREMGDPLVMPQTGRLDQALIDTVKEWIDNGAVYRQ